MTRWYRAYEGTVTDEKIIEAALIADVTRSVTVASWHCILESASKVGNCGSFDTSARRVAAILGEPLDKIGGLFDAFSELGMVIDGAVASWKKRQYHSDDSKERVRKHREKKRAGTVAEEDVTPCNGDVTPPEAETEAERLPSKDGSPSGDGPAYRAENVFEGYQALALELGLPVPRDFTPERRQLVRGRMSQYSLDDFLTVFAKCRGSPFLRGDKSDRGTPLAFDWLFKKANFQKTLEGNYD